MAAHNFTPVDAFTDPVTGPSDGDQGTQANFDLAPQALTNRTFYNNQRIPGAISSCRVAFNPFAGAVNSGTGTWDQGAVWVNSARGTAGFSLVLQPAISCTITGLSAWITPPGAHGALPAVMPTLYCSAVDVQGGSISSPENTTDPSASVGVYEAHHPVVLTLGTPIVIVPGAAKLVVATFVGESGTNSIDGLTVYGIEALVAP